MQSNAKKCNAKQSKAKQSKSIGKSISRLCVDDAEYHSPRAAEHHSWCKTAFWVIKVPYRAHFGQKCPSKGPGTPAGHPRDTRGTPRELRESTASSNSFVLLRHMHPLAKLAKLATLAKLVAGACAQVKSWETDTGPVPATTSGRICPSASFASFASKSFSCAETQDPQLAINSQN